MPTPGQKTPLNKAEARKKSVSVEGRLRRLDPDMGLKYQDTAVKIINMLKESKQLIKTGEFDNLVNSLF